MLLKVLIFVLLVPRAAAIDTSFNATLGYPGEGPEGGRILRSWSEGFVVEANEPPF